MEKFLDRVTDPARHPSKRMITTENYASYLRIAQIIRVDYEKAVCDVNYLDGIGGEPCIAITAPYAGPGSFLGAMPSINDVVIISYAMSGSFAKPYIVQYLPRNYELALRSDVVGSSPTYQDIQENVRYRMRKLYEGEIYASSIHGSEIILDKNFTIANSKLNEITLDSAEQSFNVSSLNTYLNSAGVRVMSGLAHRNALINDPLFQKPNKSFPIYINENGVPYYTPNFTNPINATYPYGTKTINDGNDAFTEHRIEVKELTQPIAPVTQSNSGADIDAFYKSRQDGSSDKPMVVQVLGTLVGNDPVGEKDKYGVILKPKLFPDPETFKGSLTEEACLAEDGNNETTSTAAAYTLKFPNSGTAFYVNKQGKYFANIAASSPSDTLGAGESAEINLKGHAKIYMGKNAGKQRSLSFATAGGVYTNWGFDSQKSRSWEASFRKGVSWNIVGTDRDNVALSMELAGDERRIITGSRFTEIKGDDIRLVHGTLEDRVLGRKVDNFVNDKATNYGGKYNENSVGHYSQVLSAGKSVTINAPDVLAGSTVADKKEIKLGDSELTMLLGSKKEKILVGAHETTILAGQKSVSITAGNYKVDVTAGNISIKTLAGSVEVGTLAGTVKIQGSLGVTIQSAVGVKVEAPKVDIGGLPVRGGIVNSGPAGHKDYLTGLPLLGSSTCTVNSV
jgi:hypothetical protein